MTGGTVGDMKHRAGMQVHFPDPPVHIGKDVIGIAVRVA
jgi:hypothetical protein